MNRCGSNLGDDAVSVAHTAIDAASTAGPASFEDPDILARAFKDGDKVKGEEKWFFNYRDVLAGQIPPNHVNKAALCKQLSSLDVRAVVPCVLQLIRLPLSRPSMQKIPTRSRTS